MQKQIGYACITIGQKDLKMPFFGYKELSLSTSALSNENFLVPDVSAQDNYIACNLDVRSELVVPLFLEGKNIGQIDVDSRTPNPFSKKDEKFLSNICNLISSTYGNLLTQL